MSSFMTSPSSSAPASWWSRNQPKNDSWSECDLLWSPFWLAFDFVKSCTATTGGWLEILLHFQHRTGTYSTFSWAETLKMHNARMLHTHNTHPFNGLCPGLPVWASTRKVKPIWILLRQWVAICKSAPRSRHITMPVPHHSVFYRPDALPAAQPTASKQ